MAAVPAVYAQQTTSDIRGQVVDELGNPLAGASVTVVDTRTNQTRQASTNAQGQFSARNLSIGGPFRVTVDAEGRQSQVTEGIFLSVGGTTNLDFQLAGATSEARTLDAVVVTGTRGSGPLQPLAIGPGTSFGLDKLTTLPSINRDLRDTISLDPRVVIDETNGDNISCLGGNNRSNAFTVDGVRQADSFGLNASGFPTRNSTPIPFDAIQEVSVEFAPFDVEYGQFTGCAINVVTVAGTNEFHGSAVFVYSNDNLFGDSLNGVEQGPFDFDNLNWGAQLSGPIIKDKLFFAVTYEQFADTDFAPNGPAELNFSNPSESSQAQIEAIQNIAENQFGFASGGLPTTLDEENTRILARLDWLINDRHRAEFTYSYVDEAFIQPDLGGFFFGPFGGTDVQFGNSFNVSGTRSDSYSLRLFSEWTDNFSTEVRVSRNDVRDRQGPVGGGEAQDGNPIPRFIVGTEQLDDLGAFIPEFDPVTGEPNCVGDPVFGGLCFNDDAVLAAGPGTFRSANALEVETDQIKIKAEYLAGNHTLTAGYELDSVDVFNLFATNATGAFIFNTTEDFANGQASSIFANGSFSGDINDAAASFRRNIHSLYAQDKWQITPDLTILLGLRYDFYQSDDNPTESQAFLDRYGFSNSTGFNNLDAVLPRLGVTYESPLDLFGRTTFTGGVGIFAGADPSVFFSNAFSNFGGGIGAGTTFGAPCGPADLIITTGAVPQCIIDQQQAETALGLGRTDAIDPNLELPTAIRYNIGFNHQTDFRGAAGGFFDDWTIGVDYIHTINKNALDFVDLTLTPIGVANDGRPIFNAIDPLNAGCNAVFLGPRTGFSAPAEQLRNASSDGTIPAGDCDSGGDDQDILLTNAQGPSGNSDVASIQLAKRFDYEVPRLGDGAVSLNIGYAYTDVTNVNPVNSAQATSSFEEVATAAINNSRVATASSFSTNTVTVSARFEQDFFTDLTTALTLRYRGRSGRNFSFAFDSGGSDFGDSDNEDRNLLFIPELNDPNVVFATPADEAGFNQFIAEQGLDGLRGSIIGRNTQQDPFFNDLDLRFEQELPTFLNAYLPNARGLFFMDINNVLNLINSNRNVFEFVRRGDVGEAVPVIDVTVEDDGTFTLFDFDDDLLQANGGNILASQRPSLWQIQFGVRFEF